MFTFKNVSIHERNEQIIVIALFVASIIVGLVIANTELFSDQSFSAGYMVGSLMACLILFSIYMMIDSLFLNKNRKDVS
ncbi:hypothetical protein [Texcoconibacillus texcoconensis]|uniref:Uncharacterized protein n=1 Tax=Texcoconibacillus texcoconensis TaxID=1095777 RepID=A0A840QPJ4_9BACI|nr:hypothetical protein [Texcoconibacillus texcoconensis]MBB5173336.1 hypothetical protein [Texcoconibacillus texcoconensis]